MILAMAFVCILNQSVLTSRTPSGRYDIDRGQGKGTRQGLTSKSARSKATKETTVTLQRVKCNSLHRIHVILRPPTLGDCNTI